MKLDGTSSGTSYLIDAVRNIVILNISLISGIVEYQRIVMKGIVDPLTQLSLRDDGTCGVVGITEIDDIHVTVFGYGGRKTVLCRTWHIDDIGPPAVLKSSAAPNHHVGVNIDGINGICHSDEVVPMEHLLDIARVRLGAVIDEYLIDVEMDATGQEVVL